MFYECFTCHLLTLSFAKCETPFVSTGRLLHDTLDARKQRKMTSITVDNPIKAAKAQTTNGNEKDLELSVVVGICNGDVDLMLFNCLENFMKERCIRGLFAVEKGGMLNHMLILITSTSIKVV